MASIPYKGTAFETTIARTKTVGLKKAMDRVAAYNLSRAKPTLEAAALAGGKVAQDWIVESMGEGKTGRSYPHLPTQPSSHESGEETPAIQTKQLVNSIKDGLRNTDSGSPYIGRAILGASAFSKAGWPYALRLEFGYGRLAARPYMRPAITNNEDEIAKAMVDVCNDEWRRLSAKVGS